MEFRAGTNVYTADNQQVGRVKHVVMTPRDQQITGLVIERGWLFKEERVLPFDWIDTANDKGDIILRADKREFDALPAFEDTLYIPREDVRGESNVPADVFYYYGNPMYVGNPGYMPPVAAYPSAVETVPRYAEKTVENIPDGTVALAIGADVHSRDDKHVGKLDEIITDSGAHGATHFLISKGLFFLTRKLVPTDWIARVSENNVYLSVNATLLERLPDYDTYSWKREPK